MSYYAVITRVPPEGSFGNMAEAATSTWIELEQPGPSNNYEGRYEPITRAFGMGALMFRTPVFRLGEILVLDHNDRDQWGRKPDKWSVETEAFEDAQAAMERSWEVTAEIRR